MLFESNTTSYNTLLLTINDPSGTYLSEPSFNENRTSPSTNRHRYAELFKRIRVSEKEYPHGPFR